MTAPDDALADARSAGSTASRRVLLVGGAAAVLLLAFAGLTAGALRRDVRAELRRLGQRGATLSQQAAFVLAESLSAVLPGVVAGLVVGIAAVAIIAQRSHVPVGPALSHGLATPASIALVAAGSLGALAVVAFALFRPASGRPSGVRPVDMAAVGAVVALALLLAGGSRDEGTLSAGPALTLAATPLLASFAFAVLLGRLLEPAIRVGAAGFGQGPGHAPPGAAGPPPLPLARRRRRGIPRRLGRPRDVRALLPRHARQLEQRASGLRGPAGLHAQRGRGARGAA